MSIIRGEEVHDTEAPDMEELTERQIRVAVNTTFRKYTCPDCGAENITQTVGGKSNNTECECGAEFSVL